VYLLIVIISMVSNCECEGEFEEFKHGVVVDRGVGG